jgi:hypothetical protein
MALLIPQFSYEWVGLHFIAPDNSVIELQRYPAFLSLADLTVPRRPYGPDKTN